MVLLLLLLVVVLLLLPCCSLSAKYPMLSHFPPIFPFHFLYHLPPPRTELKSTSKTHVTFQCMPLQTSHIFTKREICIHSHCIQPPLPPSPPLSTPMRYTWQWYIYLTNSCDITAESLRRSDCVPTSTMGVRVFRKIGVHFSRTATNVSGLITEKHNKNTSLSG